jgi:gluconokinase
MSSHPSATRVLAVDIGTSSVRAMVFDPTGTIHARVQIGYGTTRPAPYFEEQDPDLVRGEVVRAMAECLARPGAEPGSVAAICFSSQMYGIFPLDAEDRPLTFNILWSDGRAERQAAALRALLGERGLYAETGCPMNSIYPLAKLAWLKEVRPDVFGAARRFVSIKEYVTRDLVGEWAVDYSMASATGMLDIRARRWHPRALDLAGVEERQLSRPTSGIEAFALRPGSPLEGLGLPAGVRVFLGGGDGPLANLGSGASSVGAINIDLGTSGAARCIADAPTVDDAASLWCFCLTDELWAYGGIVTNVGNAYQWLGSELIGAGRMEPEAAFDLMNTLAAPVEPGAGGLYFLPYLRKARSPWWDDRLKGTLYGLNADHGAGHVARALLEAVAFDLKAIIGLMDARVRTVPHIILTGGLSRSPIIPQLLADVLGRELRTPEDGEGSVAGAAILGLRGLGETADLAFAGGPRAYRPHVPQAARTDRYDHLYRGFLRLVEAVRALDLGDGGRA